MIKWISASIQWIKSFFGKKKNEAPLINSLATDDNVSIVSNSAIDAVKQNKPPKRSSKKQKKRKNVKRKIK